MELTGAEILMECLTEQEVDTIFGYPGGTILNVYDALYSKKGIKHILTAHEQGAAHAADGYARSTGKVGVCFSTSGPGATNLITGIATAYMDSSAVVFISCNVSEPLIGKDSFQEVDSTGITLPITKSNFLVSDVNQLADTVRAAFAIARSGRQGPVFIDILKNVTAELADYEFVPRDEHWKTSKLAALLSRSRSMEMKAPEVDHEDIDLLVEKIKECEKPLVICGGGVVKARAQAEITKFIETIDSPVALTIMGAGAVKGRNKLVTGMIGMHGSEASNMACDNCDLLIAIGCRFSDRVALDPKTFASHAYIVHIDIDRAEINKNIRTDHHVIGDAKQVLVELNERVEQKNNKEWKDFVFSYPTEVSYDEVPGILTPDQVLEAIAKRLPEDTMVATDVGQHQMWAIQHFHFDYPGQLMTSGGFGAMGFGLGAAIGAKLGNPDKTVVHITGDGSFRMNCHELATEEYYKIPIITFIFNNGTLGMVRQWQHLIYNEHYSQTDLDRGPDFVKLAEAYGLKGARATNEEELQAAIDMALENQAKGLGCVIDCKIDIDEMVRPMVEGGARITNFIVN